MDIQTCYPVHPVLKKYIEYYYFLKTDSEMYSSTYYAFPNLLQSLNIHRHASCQIDTYSTYVRGNPADAPLMIVQGQHESPLFVRLSGCLDKITILFKPLGLNHFISKPLITVAGCTSQVFTDWDDAVNYKSFLTSFFTTGDNNQRISVLEEYLLTLYRELKEEDALQRSIALLTDFDTKYRIESIAALVGFSTRSFNRLFVKHLGIAPVGFRKIARFRHSLQNKLFQARFRTLTNIAYESNYYDQSYFHKMYKHLTGQNPMKFFSSIDSLADNRLVFQFVKK